MTTFAKILIFVNVGLSLMFAAWALGIYSQRVDWGGKPATAEKPAGQLALRTEEIKRLLDSRSRVELRWDAALRDLRRAQQKLAANEKWYADQLRRLETSEMPVQGLVYNRGVLQIDPATDRPVLQPMRDKAGQPMPSLLSLGKQYEQLQNDTNAEMQTVDRLVKEEKELTLELTGDGAARKGLRPQLAAEQLARQNSLLEQDWLEPLRYNRQVEASLVQKRQRALKARLDELKSATTARRP